MNFKKLNRIFNPKTIALIGATDRPGSVGLGICRNLLEGKKDRKIFFVNPFRKKIFGQKSYSVIGAIKKPIDLAIVVVPAKIVLKIIKEIVREKVGGIIIISAGFAEAGKKGKILQDKIIETVKKVDIPLVGPNCLGILRPSINLNASFAPVSPQKGKIAFISQSGALVDSIIDRSFVENYGFSLIVSYGNEAGLSMCDFLEWAKDDPETKAIGVYVEAIKDGRRFMKVAREVVKKKPLLILKAGKTKTGQKAVSSHTAALAGSQKICSAAFKQVGALEVDSLEELFDNLEALAWQPRCKNGIAVLTNGGGCGVLVADYCEKLGVKLSKLDQKVFRKLEKSKIMHPSFSRGNPLDIIGDALSDRYELAMEVLLSQKNVHGLIVAQTLQTMTEVEENAKVTIAAKKRWPKKPIIALFMGGKYILPGEKMLEKNKIPNYSDPRRAALAISALIKNK